MDLIKFDEKAARQVAQHIIAAVLRGAPPAGQSATVEGYVSDGLMTAYTLGKCEAYAEMCRPVKGGDDGNG